nr:MAG TPA: hypothetical protein [Caudoviricetes sp.]
MTTHTEIATTDLVAEQISDIPAVQDGLVDIRVGWDEYYRAWRVYTRTPIHDPEGQLVDCTEWDQVGWAADGTPEQVIAGVCEAVHPGAILAGRWQDEDGILYESTTIEADGDNAADVHVGFYRLAEEPEALIACAATDTSGWQGGLDWYAPGQDGVTIEGVEDPDRCGSMTELIRELAADAEE